MRKRGFTLVEMLAVVIILGLLIIVAIPQIQNQLLTKKDAVNEATLALIYEAADSFVESRPSQFQKMYISESEHASYCITLKDLVDAGKLEAPIKDYSTGNEMDLNTFVEINSNEYDEFVYELIEGECSENATVVEPYTQTLLNGNDPVLVDGMIPVVYDTNSSSWVKADTYKEWYNYSTSGKKWANAVTVNKKASTCRGDECIDSIDKHTRIGYEMAIPGTKISMDDINAMYVWIPKYSYQINTTSKYFNVKFESTASSGYTLHSAFGSKTGMWVAKFEASAKKDSLCESENNLEFCNNSYIRIESMPNKNSLRHISIANAMTVSNRIASGNEEYGLDETKVDSHLMKNTEWGAVAYLTRSSYGIGTSREIYVNRYYDSTNQKSLTGCSNGGAGTGKGMITTCSYRYNHASSYGGTTTGNIYGIYDMSGGAWEFVAGNYNSQKSLSGLEAIDTNYINVYTAAAGCAESVCPGAAITSTAGWLDDQTLSTFTNTYPWLVRGGYWGVTDSKLLGIFAASVDDGDASPNISFRPVITIK